MLSFLPFRTLRLSSPPSSPVDLVPTPMGGSAPLSTAPPPPAAVASSSRSSPPEFEIPYDFVSEVPMSDGQRRWNNFVQKNKQNPFIALGTAATFFALVGAVRSMRAGNQKQMQLFFRLRVGAQAFAIVAVVIGGVLYEGAHPVKSLLNIPANARAGYERNAEKAEALQQALDNPNSPEALRAAKVPPTLTPKRSFQDHAAAEAAKHQDASLASTPEDRMRQAMKAREEDAALSREDRRNKFKLA